MGEKNANAALPRRMTLLFPVELATFAAIFWADWAGHIPLSKTPFLFVAAWIFMAMRGVTWRSVGFRGSRHWVLLIVAGVAAGTAMFLFEFFGLQQLIFRLTGEYPDLHELDDLVGNLQLLIILLGLNLVLAALLEELVWRGYALPRVASLLGSGAFAWIAALVLVNVAFGAAHLYQGLPGVIENIVAGFWLGVIYLAAGRNLIAPMAAHFTSNTIDLTVIYLGNYPGVGP